MEFEKQLVKGTLIKRYKRFLADVALDSGEIVTAHCTNSGSMKTCLQEGAPVMLTPVDDPKRKTKFTWEMIMIDGQWVGINTSLPNQSVYEWVKNGVLEELNGYTHVKREVKFGDSRFDVMAENDTERCFIEVKNVTMKAGRFARFPDAKTTRGKKHLETLVQVKQAGMRAVMVFVIQRMDVEIFGPAWDIDPDYAQTLSDAYQKGVEIIPVQVKVTPQNITFWRKLPFDLTRKQA